MSLQNSHQISDVKVMLKQGKDGNGIESIEKTGTSGNVDTYTITFTDGTKTTYTVTNGESGGIYPHIIVISESGSTVTLTKGSTVITASETSTGHFEADVPEFGTWTIDAILGGDDAQVSLVVDTVKVYTIDDSNFHATVTVKYPEGATCRLQSIDETFYATGSPYTFTVHHAETYTITVTYNQRIYTDTVTFTTEGQSFSKTVPTPSEAVANDINMWLFFGDVSGTFSTLSDILADSTALATLMASTDAVDYLVRCTNWISDICGNQSAMSYIGLNNYCANTLLADSDWRDGIANSTYFESVLNIHIPTMTSDTTPSGHCYANSVDSGYSIYSAMDKKDATGWCAQHAINPLYLYYQFANSVKCLVSKMMFQSGQSVGRLIPFDIIASNDGTNWTTLDSYTDLGATTTKVTKEYVFDNDTSYKYYGFKFNHYLTFSGQYRITIFEMDFYGRADV